MQCYNCDKDGKCLAYTKKEGCGPECPARIATIEDKIALLNRLLEYARSQNDKTNIRKELAEAHTVKEAKDSGKCDGWMSCYYQDLRRGEKGGASEGDSNRTTGMKTLMKDNRPIGIKPTRAQNEEYQEALHSFEDKVGEKMEKLGRTSMTHSKVDSYTQLPICFMDDGYGTCKGQRSAADKLSKDCRDCGFLKI